MHIIPLSKSAIHPLKIVVLFIFVLLYAHVHAQISIEWENPSVYSGNDYGTTVCVDNFGNVYSGGSRHNPTFFDRTFWVTKHNDSGLLLWERLYSANSTSDETVYDIVCDEDGSVYVAGYYWAGTNWNTAVVKYDSSGTQQWDTVFSGKQNSTQAKCYLAVDDSLNRVYLATSAALTSSYYYSLVAIQMSNGTAIWNRMHTSYSGEFLTDVVVDSKHNIAVTGNAGSASFPDDAIITLKYDINGVLIWNDILIPPSSDLNLAYGIASDYVGNTYVVGCSSFLGPAMEGTVFRYDSLGTLRWTATYSMSSYVSCHDVIVDTSGLIYLTGGVMVGSSNQPFVSCIDSSGSILWTRIDSTLLGGVQGFQIIFGNDGLLYCRTNHDIMCYSKSGGHIWSWRLPSLRRFGDLCAGVSSDLYGVGDYTDTLSSYTTDMITMKFSDSTLSSIVGLRMSDGVLFPNPADDEIYFRSMAPVNCVQWRILSITGTVVREGSFTGNNVPVSVSGLPSGIYLMEYTADSFTELRVQKFVIR